MNQTWIRLPPARKGAKCPISGWSRRTLQRMIYGVPSQGITPTVKFRKVDGAGKGDKGTVLIYVPSLIRAMAGEPDLPAETAAALRMLANSPEWCQQAIRSLLDLSNDRAGMTVTDFFHYILATNHEPTTQNPTRNGASIRRLYDAPSLRQTAAR